jgi:hypothetical protein
MGGEVVGATVVVEATGSMTPRVVVATESTTPIVVVAVGDVVATDGASVVLDTAALVVVSTTAAGAEGV